MHSQIIYKWSHKANNNQNSFRPAISGIYLLLIPTNYFTPSCGDNNYLYWPLDLDQMATFKFNWTSPLSWAILVSHPPVLKNKQTCLWSCPHDRSVPLDTVCLSLSSFLLLAPSHLVCSVAVKWHSGRCLMTEVCVSLSIQLCTIDWVWSDTFIWIEDNRRPVPAGFGQYWTYNDAQNHLCLCWFATQAGESCPEVICHSSCSVDTF